MIDNEIERAIEEGALDLEPEIMEEIEVHLRSASGSNGNANTSSTISMDIACDKGTMMEKMDQWEKLRLEERTIFDRIIFVLFQIHHPLKIGTDDLVIPLMKEKQQELQISLMQCIEKQYQVFREIRTGLEVCYDLEKTPGSKDDTDAEENDQQQKFRVYEEVQKKWKETVETRQEQSKSWLEMVQECEKKLNEYFPKVTSQDKLIAEELDNKKKLQKRLKEIEQYLDEGVKSKQEIPRRPRDVCWSPCKQQTKPYQNNGTNTCIKKRQSCVQIRSNVLDDFLKIAIPEKDEIPFSGDFLRRSTVTCNKQKKPKPKNSKTICKQSCIKVCNTLEDFLKIPIPEIYKK
ncbi:hypothetical protein WDU94_014095 [Cyamophila willieti]